MNMKNATLGVIAALATGLCVAQDMNLGDATPAPPGTFAYINYFGGLEADSLYSRGNRIDAKARVVYSANRFAYFTKFGDFNGVFNAIIPVARANVNIPAAGINDRQSGIGDPVLVAAFYPISDVAKRSHVVVAGLLSVPWGRYESGRPVTSPGANRYSFTSELGVDQGLGSWTLSANAQVKFFGNNDDFAGAKLETKPLLRLQAGAFYNLSPTSYLGGKIKHERGARELINGVESSGDVRLTRVALEFGMFFTERDQIIFAPFFDASVRNGLKAKGAQVRYLHVF